MSAGDSPDQVKPSKASSDKVQPSDDSNEDGKLAAAAQEPAGEDSEEAKKQEPSLDDTAAQPPEESEDESDDPQAEAEREKERRRALQQRFWRSAIGFWKGGAKRFPVTCTTGCVVLVQKGGVEGLIIGAAQKK